MHAESDITERLRKLAVIPSGSPVELGIGDDCAIYRPRGSADDLLFTSDMLVEGTHFLRGTHTPSELGRKALARSLSDVAAMGGEPRFALVSLCVPAWAGPKFTDQFFNGVLKIAAATGTVLAGGDLSHGDSLSCDVTVCGSVPRGTGIRRSGARVGDQVWVSGALGGSALGFETRMGKAWNHHRNPVPRLALGRFVRQTVRATAAMDLSDGLSLDLRRLCLASGAAASISMPPRFPGATAQHALHGGEDYELVFTVRPGTRVPATCEALPLTCIGEIISGVPGDIFLGSEPLAPLGYDHFKSHAVKLKEHL